MNDKTNSNNLIKEQKSTEQLQDITNEDSLQKKKKPKLSVQEYEDKLNYLQQKYPKCFTSPPSPLAIEIHKEFHILEKNIISKTKINRVLARYVRSKDYRKALIENSDRLNLDGSLHSKVTREQLTRQKWKKSFKAKQQDLDSNYNKEREIDL